MDSIIKINSLSNKQLYKLLWEYDEMVLGCGGDWSRSDLLHRLYPRPRNIEISICNTFMVSTKTGKYFIDHTTKLKNIITKYSAHKLLIYQESVPSFVQKGEWDDILTNIFKYYY